MGSRAEREGPALVTSARSILGVAGPDEVWLVYCVTASRVAGLGTASLRLDVDGVALVEVAVASPGSPSSPLNARIVLDGGEELGATMLGALDTARVAVHYARLTR